jgi:hypothetical protein
MTTVMERAIRYAHGLALLVVRAVEGYRDFDIVSATILSYLIPIYHAFQIRQQDLFVPGYYYISAVVINHTRSCFTYLQCSALTGGMSEVSDVTGEKR